jgi:hypothetical protein
MRSRTAFIVGALASAALLFAGCTDTPPQDLAREQQELGTGGSGPAAPPAKGHKGHKGHEAADAGVGDAGTAGSPSTGTTGQGVTGGSEKEARPSSGPSGN